MNLHGFPCHITGKEDGRILAAQPLHKIICDLRINLSEQSNHSNFLTMVIYGLCLY